MADQQKDKTIGGFIKRNWTRIWLITIACAVSTLGVYAAYTEVSSVKRVVSTQASPGDKFSSNCMRKDTTSRRLTADSFSVSVCNFDQDYPKDYSTAPITYTMEAELLIKIGNSDYLTFADLADMVAEGTLTPEAYKSYVKKAANYSIAKTEDDIKTEENPTGVISNPVYQPFAIQSQTDPDTYVLNQVSFTSDTLEANKSSTDFYTVNIDPADKNASPTSNGEPEVQFLVYVKADPDGVLHDVSARLYRTSASDEQSTWRGSVQEELSATDSEGNPRVKDFDYYNYVVTGNGNGTVNIYWDPKKIEINKYVLEMNGWTIKDSDNTTDYNEWSMISFDVNSLQKSRYELQLYKVEDNSNMVDPSAYIHLTFQSAQN